MDYLELDFSNWTNGTRDLELDYWEKKSLKNVLPVFLWWRDEWNTFSAVGTGGPSAAPDGVTMRMVRPHIYYRCTECSL